MIYDKVIIDEFGEKFPYSETFDSEGYHYKISVVFKDRDGELNILNEGAHIEFDDDGSWLDFNVRPKKLFECQNKLSDENLLEFMDLIASGEVESKSYAKEEMNQFLVKFKNQK